MFQASYKVEINYSNHQGMVAKIDMVLPFIPVEGMKIRLNKGVFAKIKQNVVTVGLVTYDFDREVFVLQVG